MFSLETVFLEVLEILHDFDLNFRVVVLVFILFVLQTFLGHLLVIHGVLGLVDGEGTADLLHLRLRSLLTDVQGHFRDVLNLSLNEFLMVSRR